MQLTVLAVPDCPNALVLEDRLAAVLDGQAGALVSREVISSEAEAASWGMRGSPTLLIRRGGPIRPARAAAEHIVPLVSR
jgi:hypothetical protein